MHFHSRRCDGMDTVPTGGTSSLRRLRTRCRCLPGSGESSMMPIADAMRSSTEASPKSRPRSSNRFFESRMKWRSASEPLRRSKTDRHGRWRRLRHLDVYTSKATNHLDLGTKEILVALETSRY